MARPPHLRLESCGQGLRGGVVCAGTDLEGKVDTLGRAEPILGIATSASLVQAMGRLSLETGFRGKETGPKAERNMRVSGLDFWIQAPAEGSRNPPGAMEEPTVPPKILVSLTVYQWDTFFLSKLLGSVLANFLFDP